MRKSTPDIEHTGRGILTTAVLLPLLRKLAVILTLLAAFSMPVGAAASYNPDHMRSVASHGAAVYDVATQAGLSHDAHPDGRSDISVYSSIVHSLAMPDDGCCPDAAGHGKNAMNCAQICLSHCNSAHLSVAVGGDDVGMGQSVLSGAVVWRSFYSAPLDPPPRKLS